MPKIRFDPSQIPLWRKKPRRLEAPIKAYRCWKLREVERHEFRLASITMQTIWNGPVLRANVKPFDSETWDKYLKERPDRDKEYAVGSLIPTPCLTWNSGIYALDTKEYAIETAEIYRVDVIGQVDLWGRVVIFERGYRAEICMIKKLWILYKGSELENSDISNALYPMTSLLKVVPSLQRAYGCDVEVM